MRTVRIEGADPRPIGAPEEWTKDNGHCGALFVRREEVSGITYMRSAWEADPREAALLLAGAKLELGISSRVHPVVSLGVGALPVDFEPVVTAMRFTSPKGEACVRVEMLFCHAGGRRAYSDLLVGSSLGQAVAEGIDHIEGLARREGWIE